MAVEVNSSKNLYKIELYLIKVIPAIISIIYLLNTVLSYFNIDIPILSYIVMYLLIIFLYMSSIAFKFCRWHRILLHYITLNLTLNIIDYYIGIPISNKELFMLYMIITGIFICSLVYYRKHDQLCKKVPGKIIKRYC